MDDDSTKQDQAWHHAVADIKPLKSRASSLIPTHKDHEDSVPIPKAMFTEPKAAPAINEKRQENDDVRAHAAVPPPPAPETAQPIDMISHTATCIAGKVTGMDNKLFTRFKRGQLGVERTYDLHGHYEGDAWLATHNFIHECVSLEMRTVLIIHGKGKGYGPAGNMGLIKSQIAQWLCQHAKVLAFHTAQPKDGGCGAIYVYLKKW